MSANSFQVVRTLWKLKLLYKKQFSALLEREKLTMREIKILLFFTNASDYNTARDAVKEGVAKSQVSLAVEILVRKGLLQRIPDRIDRRVVRLMPTEAGKALGCQAKEIQDAFVQMLFSPLSEDERIQFMFLFEKVLKKIEQSDN